MLWDAGFAAQIAQVKYTRLGILLYVSSPFVAFSSSTLSSTRTLAKLTMPSRSKGGASVASTWETNVANACKCGTEWSAQPVLVYSRVHSCWVCQHFTRLEYSDSKWHLYLVHEKLSQSFLLAKDRAISSFWSFSSVHPWKVTMESQHSSAKGFGSKLHVRDGLASTKTHRMEACTKFSGCCTQLAANNTSTSLVQISYQILEMVFVHCINHLRKKKLPYGMGQS